MSEKSVKSSTKISSKKRKSNDIYIKSIISKYILLNFTEVDENIKETLTKKLAGEYEGKCGIEGFIKKDSINIITFSCGEIKAEKISYIVVFECLVCHPVEGMKINCIVNDITKAGIRASLPDDNSLVIFVARDHHYQSQKFSSIKIDEEIKIKVLGKRYELNDTFIAVIGELVINKDTVENTKSLPKLIVKE